MAFAKGGWEELSFSCELEVGEAPEVVVRYVTRENPEKVSLWKYIFENKCIFV